jgi:hypothetical protein
MVRPRERYDLQPANSAIYLPFWFWRRLFVWRIRPYSCFFCTASLGASPDLNLAAVHRTAGPPMHSKPLPLIPVVQYSVCACHRFDDRLVLLLLIDQPAGSRPCLAASHVRFLSSKASHEIWGDVLMCKQQQQRGIRALLLWAYNGCLRGCLVAARCSPCHARSCYTALANVWFVLTLR